MEFRPMRRKRLFLRQARHMVVRRGPRRRQDLRRLWRRYLPLERRLLEMHPGKLCAICRVMLPEILQNAAPSPSISSGFDPDICPADICSRCPVPSVSCARGRMFSDSTRSGFAGVRKFRIIALYHSPSNP